MSGYFLKGVASLLIAEIDLIGDNLKIVGIDTGVDTPVTATDEFLADIAIGARVVTSANLGSKILTTGSGYVQLEAAGQTILGVTGASFEMCALYKDTGNVATSPLIYLWTTATGSPGLPLTPNGGNVDVSFPSGYVLRFSG